MDENKSIQTELDKIINNVVSATRRNTSDNLIIWKNNHKEELLYKNANELIDEIAEMIRQGDI